MKDVGFSRRIVGGRRFRAGGKFLLMAGLLLWLAWPWLSTTAHAEASTPPASDSSAYDDYYEQQKELSGADGLPDELPNDTRVLLENMGVDGPDWQSLQGLTPQTVFDQLLSSAKEQSSAPIKAAVGVLGIMLLCALMEGMKLSFGDRPISGVMGVVSTLCVCGVVVAPLVSCISEVAEGIQAAARFMLCLIPVMVGILIAGGQVGSATSYHLLMMGAGELISQIASGFLVPMLNVFLALSITSAVASRLNLDGICEMFTKVVKWVLGISMTVFVSLLTLQTVIGSAADSTGTKAAKFMISSFVPVVGSALSDAFNTVQSCVKLLKSGVGAFGILAVAVLFLPLLVKCLLWMACTHLCACVGDVFALRELAKLLRAVGKTISLLLAILLSCLTILTISTMLVVVLGGGGT